MNRIIITTVSLLIVIGASSFWSYLARPDKSGIDLYPEKLQVRILLPDHENGEFSREVTFAKDESVEMVKVNYPDGSYGHAYYRDDGTVAQVIKYHPDVEGSLPVVMTEAFYADDGEKLVSEKHYLKDGTLNRTGSRLASGDYLVQVFALDGVDIASEMVFTDKGKKYDVFERHSNGNFKRLVRNFSGGHEETTFHENGLKAAFNSVIGSQKVWERYQEDGTTPIVKFALKGEGDHHSYTYKVYASYFNADGSINHKREFTRYYMAVLYYDDNGEFTHQQRWLNKTGNSGEITTLGPDQWYLNAVYLGEDLIGSDSIWFDSEGRVEKYMKRIDLPGGGYKLATWEYHPDGSLKLYRRPDLANPGGKFVTDNYEPGESAERFDTSLLAGKLDTIAYEEPPEIPPEVEYYEH